MDNKFYFKLLELFAIYLAIKLEVKNNSVKESQLDFFVGVILYTIFIEITIGLLVWICHI